MEVLGGKAQDALRGGLRGTGTAEDAFGKDIYA